MPRADLRRAGRERLTLSPGESQARHRALLGALPDGVLLQDSDGTVLLANTRAGALLGVTVPDDALIPDGVVPSVIPAPRRGPAPVAGHRRPTPGDSPLDRLTAAARGLL